MNIITILAITLPWFLKPGYLFFTDFAWGPNAPVDWWRNSFLPALAMRVLSFAMPPDFVEKLFISAVLLVVFVGGQRIARRCIADRRFAFVAGLFFLFNPFVYDRLGYGQVYLLLAMGLFFCGVAELLALSQGERTTRRGILIAAVWFGLAIQFAPHFVFLAGLTSFAWFASYLADPKHRTKALLTTLGLGCLSVLALNANWLLGRALGVNTAVPNITHADLEAFRTSGKTGADALINVVLMSGFWGKDQLRYPDLTLFKENWGRSFFFLLPLMLWGLFDALRDRKRRPVAIAIAAAGALSVFLAVGIRLPTSREATFWLFDHVPFYSGLRETQKWVAVEVLAYGIFLSWGINRLIKTAIVRANRGMSAIFLAAFIVMQAPTMLWGMNGAVSPTPYPDDWRTADAFIAQNGCRGKILFLPWHMYMRFGWIGNVVANPARDYFRCPVIQGTNMEWGDIEDNSGNIEGVAVAAWLASKGGSDLLTANPFGISYVILAKETDWNSYGFLDDVHDLQLVADLPTLKIYAVAAK